MAFIAATRHSIMSDTILPRFQTRSSHVTLRWLSLKHGNAPGVGVDALSHFATQMLRKLEQVEGRNEVSRAYGRVNRGDVKWLNLEKVEVFLRNLQNPKIISSLGENHHFVLAVIPGNDSKADEIVGVTQFKEAGKKILGQFTCVNPEMQGLRIGEKLHRAIHGFGRKYGYKVYEADLSSAASLRMYERMQRNPRLRVGKMPKKGITEKITIKYPRKNLDVPKAKVRIYPLLKRPRSHPR